MLGQWLEPAVETLTDTTEFPLALTAIELTEDQRRFGHSERWDLRLDTA